MADAQSRHLQTARVEVDGRRTSATVRAQLNDAEERLQRHLRTLRREFTLRDVNVADAPVLDHVRWHPLLAVGIAAGATALVTVLVSLLRRSRPQADDTEQWIRAMVHDLLDDAAARIGPDGDADAALRRALRRRAPVIVVDAPKRSGGERDRGAIAGLLLTVTKAAIGFGGKFALDYLTTELTRKAEGAGATRQTSAAEAAGAA